MDGTGCGFKFYMNLAYCYFFITYTNITLIPNLLIDYSKGMFYSLLITLFPRSVVLVLYALCCSPASHHMAGRDMENLSSSLDLCQTLLSLLHAFGRRSRHAEPFGCALTSPIPFIPPPAQRHRLLISHPLLFEIAIAHL